MKDLFDHKPHILVVGDLMLDHYLWGDCGRISPEAPVPVVHVRRETALLGGCGNVAVSLAVLGAEVSVCGVIGDDPDGRTILSLFREKKINADGVFKESGKCTTKKTRIMSGSHQMIRFDHENTNPVSKLLTEKAVSFLLKRLREFDMILFSDYSKGFLKEALTQKIIQKAVSLGIKTIVDPKDPDFSKYSGAYMIKPNKKEASSALNRSLDTKEDLEQGLIELKKRYNLAVSCMTLGSEGMVFYENRYIKLPAFAKEVYDVTGAGDVVLSVLGFALAGGLNIRRAAELANAAAAVAVGKIGNAAPDLSDIIHFKSGIVEKAFAKIVSRENLRGILKAVNQRVVFTNGCFDILHIGHVTYLQKAKEFGDLLVVGLNSDHSVTRLKGKGRPINSQHERAAMLAALDVVDYVVVFEDDTPYELIKAIRPDVLVKGRDYEGKTVVGSDIAAETVLIDLVEGKSTTSILKKMNH